LKDRNSANEARNKGNADKGTVDCSEGGRRDEGRGMDADWTTLASAAQ